MPPKFKFTKDEIIKAALDIVRMGGMEALTARSLAEKLCCSVKPIFGAFQNMEEVQQQVLASARALYQSYINDGIAKGSYPPYKASGMAYISFAKDEKELFKLLFMRDRSSEAIEEDREEIRPLLELIQKQTGLSEDDAFLFHLEMWIFVHGIATMIATSYLEWDDEFINRVITDAYLGVKSRRENKKENAE